MFLAGKVFRNSPADVGGMNMIKEAEDNSD
jgi:hypothetical protein